VVSVILALFLVLMTVPSWATTYYVDGTAGACAGNYSITNRNCTGSDGTSYATLNLSTSAVIAGDIVETRGGTYTAQINPTGRNGTVSLPITLKAYQGETVTLRPSGSVDFLLAVTNMAYWVFDFTGWVLDGINLSDEFSLQFYAGRGIHHITVINGDIFNAANSGVQIHTNDITLRGTTIHDLRSTCSLGSQYYGIYLGEGSGNTVENTEVYNTPGGAIQVYPGPFVSPPTVRNNNFHDTNTCDPNEFGVVIGNGAHGTQFYNNVLARMGTPTIQIWGGVDNVLLKKNTIYRVGGVGVHITHSTSVGTILEDNLIIAGTPVLNGGTSTVQTTNKTTGVITDYTVSTSDFTLKSGSPCIDFGTARSGFAHNGSAPDCGAFESVPNPTGSITANVITLIFPMSLNVPIQNLSTAGVTVGCTGSACPGSPTASAVARVVGTDTYVDITIAGIAGNACVAANQNWTATYNSATGSWTDNANIGVPFGLHQKIFSFTGLALTNRCSGSGPASYPAGYHIYHKFDEGTGTNANDESANNLDCTFTNSPTWGGGKTGSAMVVAAGSTQHCAMGWGSGVNPYSTNLTIVAPVLIAVGTESASHYVVGPSHGTNQRFYICSHQGTWRIAYQAVQCQNTAASSLAVTSGWNFLVIRTNGTTHVATLSKDGIAGTGGASVTLTSFTLASNLTLGRVGTLASSGGSYDDFLVYLSLQDPVTLYAVFQATASGGAGTLAQAAVQWQGVYVDSSGARINFGTLMTNLEVVANGGGTVVFQVHCQNVADCGEDAFRLVYAKNQTVAAAAASGTLLQVPNTETSDGTWMWGSTPSVGLNNGTTTTRLTGSCAITNGSMQFTADQIPSVDLPQDGCVMLGYAVRVGNVPGSYFEYRLITQSGLALTGGYAADARITVVNPRSTGIGF
jgi:hypothetical protein